MVVSDCEAFSMELPSSTKALCLTSQLSDWLAGEKKKDKGESAGNRDLMVGVAVPHSSSYLSQKAPVVT